MAFELPELGYANNAQEPHIDARTMEIHNTKPHASYTANLNAALEGHADLQGMSAEAQVADIGSLPAGIQSVIAPGANDLDAASMTVRRAAQSAFGDNDEFVAKFSASAATRFDSGQLLNDFAPDEISIDVEIQVDALVIGTDAVVFSLS